MKKDPKTKRKPRTYLVLGCSDRSQAAVVVANAIQSKRIVDGDEVQVHSEAPYVDKDGNEIPAQFGELTVGKRKEVELTYIAANPDGYLLMQTGTVLECAPIVETMKAQERKIEARKKAVAAQIKENKKPKKGTKK